MVPTFLLKAAPWAMKALPWVACAALGALAYQYTPLIGPQARLARLEASRDSWRKSADDWKRAAGGWQASFKAAEALRVSEHSAAVDGLADAQKQCDLRVKDARASAIIIRRIVDAPPKSDAAGCPVRVVVDPGSLRDALQPTAAR
jgi:hypothetical protein